LARFAIVDMNNLFFRAAKGGGKTDNAFERAAMALHITFRSLSRLAADYRVDHVVICAEGKSWRFKDHPQYKSARRLNKAMQTPEEREDEEIFIITLNDLVAYFREKTRLTVLEGGIGEGDDYIARFIQLHPNDDHIILSSDSDFLQLLAENVSIHDAMMERHITTDGVFNLKGDRLKFWVDGSSGKLKVGGTIDEERKAHKSAERERAAAHKEKQLAKAQAHNAKEQAKADAKPKYVMKPYQMVEYVPTEFSVAVEPDWWREALFVKMVRGDTGDSVPSAYPKVRYKGSKDKAGIREVWEDRHSKGFVWNNFMEQKWDKLMGTDAQGEPLVETVTVRDQIAFNERMIDLTKQPAHVLDALDGVIVEAIQKPTVSQVGLHFMKFCGKMNLPVLTNEANKHALYLNSGYPMGK